MLATIALATTLYTSPPKIRGDFDRDGRPDVAEISRYGGAYVVMIHTGAQPKKGIVVKTLGPVSGDFFLDTARSGSWKTW